jgi:catechol 2,3-dioxygenase-like lactoylglutathione lyase family enzyme
MLERIDHIVCVTPDLAAASAAHERLGLVLTPEARHAQTGSANRACFVGASAGSACYLELLSVFDAETASSSGRSHYVESMARGGGAVGIGFGVNDIHAAVTQLASAGFDAPVLSLHRDDGAKVCDVAWVDTESALGYRASLLQYPETWSDRFERSKAAGRFEHTFPLKRLDHLAAVAPDLEAATSFWARTFGVPVYGEIRTDTLVIRQLKIGDAILELLGPASPDSPMSSRPASLASVAAWEVSGSLDDAVALARSRGFTCPDPEPGVIPSTRRTTIPAAELGGMSMQLLEYV